MEKTNVRKIPEGYHSITPYISIKDAAKAIDFYKNALGAKELYRLSAPDGKVAHAELQIGDSRLMLAEEMGEMGGKAPATLGGTPVNFMIYLEDVDAASEKALNAGMKVKHPVENQFYGDRSGTFEDPFGFFWTFSTHVEDVSPEEIERRAAKMFGENPDKKTA